MIYIFFLVMRRHPRATPAAPPVPYSTLFRSVLPDRDRRPALDERDVLSTPRAPGAGRGRAPLRAVAAAARPACRGAGRGTVVRRGRLRRGPPPGIAAVERACG